MSHYQYRIDAENSSPYIFHVPTPIFELNNIKIYNKEDIEKLSFTDLVKVINNVNDQLMHTSNDQIPFTNNFLIYCVERFIDHNKDFIEKEIVDALDHIFNLGANKVEIDENLILMVYETSLKPNFSQFLNIEDYSIRTHSVLSHIFLRKIKEYIKNKSTIGDYCRL